MFNTIVKKSKSMQSSLVNKILTFYLKTSSVLLISPFCFWLILTDSCIESSLLGLFVRLVFTN